MTPGAPTSASGPWSHVYVHLAKIHNVPPLYAVSVCYMKQRSYYEKNKSVSCDMGVWVTHSVTWGNVNTQVSETQPLTLHTLVCVRPGCDGCLGRGRGTPLQGARGLAAPWITYSAHSSVYWGIFRAQKETALRLPCVRLCPGH